jgi:hypothetical protein
MANYYRNVLFIRGPGQELHRFQLDAQPKDTEKGDDSWCGHGDGSLSFLSLVPPPDELRITGANRADVEKWRWSHWGCAFPVVDYWTLDADCLGYWFSTAHFCAHNFVVSISKFYPALAFTLLWNDVYTGEYGEPMSMALLAVKNGVIVVDYVEMNWETVLAVEAQLPPLHKLTEGKRDGIWMRIELEKKWDPKMPQNGNGENAKKVKVNEKDGADIDGFFGGDISEDSLARLF